MSAFYPMRGKVAIQRIVAGEKTDAGIIVTPKENVDFCKGKVLSLGYPEQLSNGTVLNVDYNEGDYVLYNRKSVQGAMGYDIVNQQEVIAVVDEDTEIS